jgi:hypothetical protein
MQGEMVGAYAMYGRDKKYLQSFVGKLEGKQQLKRPRHRKSLTKIFCSFWGCYRYTGNLEEEFNKTMKLQIMVLCLTS